ncbi:MAG: phosphoglycerate dehydrogenase [Methanobacteriota archaeon]|nr:MAG: phosphoglycerate dehydrogenase [Euryarchaeota archaeon]
MRILVTDGLEAEAIAKLRAGHHVDLVEADPKQLLEIIPNYDALIVRSRTKVSADVIAKGAKLKVIGRAGIGVDNIDVRAATGRRVPVVNAPTGSTISVAELAIGHMLSLARQIPEADRSMKEGKWEKKRFEGRELQGKILGLVGSGRIGAEVAKRAHAFGMEVIAFDPYLPPTAAKERGIQLVDSLPALLMQADYVSVHAALTAETQGMIGAKELALMKRTAYLVNCARGEIVQEAALAEALTMGTIAGAALDVFEKEPPTGSPILSAPNTVLTPHLGASTHEAQARAGGIIAEQVLKVLRGEKPDFAVNPEVYS